MGFQINGVEYIDNNGHFVNGLKTANGNSMAGTGAITTGNSSTWGTTFLSVGSFNLGFVTTNFNASGNYGLSSGYQRKGIEQGNTAAGSGIYAIKYTNYSSNTNTYKFYPSYASYQGAATNTSSSNFDTYPGTWRAITGGFEDPTYTWYAYQGFVRIS